METDNLEYLISFLTGHILLILLILILTVSHIQKQMEELESLQQQHMNGGKTHQKDQERFHQSEL